jgi:hypothetical protein
MAERRKALRTRSRVFVTVEGVLCRSVDISPEGMMIEMPVPPPVGKRIELLVALGEKMLKMPAEVMRHVPRGEKLTGVGVKFGALNSIVRVALNQHLIAKRIEEAAKG